MNGDWDMEIPGGIDKDLLASPTGAECLTFKQESIVNDDNVNHRKIEMVDINPFD